MEREADEPTATILYDHDMVPIESNELQSEQDPPRSGDLVLCQ
jgi:hypothetical protein